MSNYFRLIRAFAENPIRKTYSTKRLMKQFNVTEEHIKEAKLMWKLVNQQIDEEQKKYLDKTASFHSDKI